VPDTRSRRWHPRWTLRLRLTVLYGSLFLLAGAILLGITYGLVAHSSSTAVAQDQQLVVTRAAGVGRLPPPFVSGAIRSGSGAVFLARPPSGARVQLKDYAGQLNATFSRASAKNIRQVTAKAKEVLAKQRSDQLSSLLTESGIALAITAVLSMGLGWMIAGRALRPVRTMSARARGISERNLHERLALDGPDDELKELGHTFDDLLGRLESAFESQRRFVSNASHELRTPITLERTLVEVALADPEVSIESLQETCKRVLAAGAQQERLIEALLTLARSQRGLDSRAEVDLAEITADVIRGIDSTGVRLTPSLAEAETTGDPRLIERLVANLLDNAVKYNAEDGWVSISTGYRDGSSVIEVVNAGAAIEPEEVSRLLEPFRRLNGDRSIPSEPVGERGLGLGLSIVDAIANAHGARLSAVPRPEGGLRVEVAFPASAPPSTNGFGAAALGAGSNL
jgi:signal transduction histidine kinase